jgi:hypothetical protein
MKSMGLYRASWFEPSRLRKKYFHMEVYCVKNFKEWYTELSKLGITAPQIGDRLNVTKAGTWPDCNESYYEFAEYPDFETTQCHIWLQFEQSCFVPVFNAEDEVPETMELQAV